MEISEYINAYMHLYDWLPFAIDKSKLLLLQRMNLLKESQIEL